MTTAPRPPRSRATVFLTVASLVSVTVLLGGIMLPSFDPRPRARWRIGEDQRKVAQFAEATANTPVFLELDLPFAAHVYLASWSRMQGTIALFPSERLSTDLMNPLPAGKHQLPGRFEDKLMSWPSHAVVGPIHYLLVVSKEPLAELNDTMRKVRQMGHMARLGTGFHDRGMYLFAPEGGMKLVPSNEQPAAKELDAARTAFTNLESLDSDGPLLELPDEPGVFVRPFVLQGK